MDIDALDSDSDDPRKHIAEMRTLYNLLNHKRRHMYTRVEHQWRNRYEHRVEWINRISADLHG